MEKNTLILIFLSKKCRKNREALIFSVGFWRVKSDRHYWEQNQPSGALPPSVCNGKTSSAFRMSRNEASAARVKRKKEEEVFERSTGGKPNSSPRDRVVFLKTCFLAGPQKSWFTVFLEQTSPDGPIQSWAALVAGGNRGFYSTQIPFPGATGALKSVSFADKTGLPSLFLTAESQHLYNFL